MNGKNGAARNPEDCYIAILTQTESQITGISTVAITVDHKSPDLKCIALESTRALFIQSSHDTYKASEVNISIFISILVGVKANGWTLMGTNAFLNNSKQEVVKTFYFEKTGSTKSFSSASSSTPIAAANSVGASYQDILKNSPRRKESFVVPQKDSSPDNVNLPHKRSSPGIDIIDHLDGGSSISHLPVRKHSHSSTPEVGSRGVLEQNYSSPQPQLINPPLPPDNNPKSPSPGATDFTKFPARSRPAGKTDKAAAGAGSSGSSGAVSEIQKKNAEYFKRMKKVFNCLPL
jgi:hypothetical protein